MGLTVRAVGHGRRSGGSPVPEKRQERGAGDSGQPCRAWSCFPFRRMKFTFLADAGGKGRRGGCARRTSRRSAFARSKVDLLVLDEAVCRHFPPENAGAALGAGAAGRLPRKRWRWSSPAQSPPELEERAAYITEDEKAQAPLDAGLPAREGVEW